jgi:hypothetical protein
MDRDRTPADRDREEHRQGEDKKYQTDMGKGQRHGRLGTGIPAYRDRGTGGQGNRLTGIGTLTDRGTNGNHGQGYGQGHEQLQHTSDKKIRALKMLNSRKFKN